MEGSLAGSSALSRLLRLSTSCCCVVVAAVPLLLVAVVVAVASSDGVCVGAAGATDAVFLTSSSRGIAATVLPVSQPLELMTVTDCRRRLSL